MNFDTESELVVISYWSGELPENTLLHFLSFRAFHPDIRYVLFLDSDSGFEGCVSSKLRLILSELDIEIEIIGLSDLMENSNIPKFSSWRRNKIFKLAKLILIWLSPLLARIFKSSNLFHFSSVKGITFSHAVPFTGFKFDLAYRADLFRALAISLFPKSDLLYLDLDICILRRIEFTNWRTGAIAQWGTDDFANSAFLYLPRSADTARSNILSNLQAGVSALPWVMYSVNQIRSYKMNIIPNRLLDPAWEPGSSIVERADLFFKAGEHVEKFMQECEELIAVHWHNQWHTVPEEDSPYMRIMGNLSWRLK